MNCILHINGRPGPGKRTIARLLAPRIGGRMLDDHALLSPAKAVFKRDDLCHAPLSEAVRSLALDHAAGLDAIVPLVLTDALADDPGDAATFERYRVLASRRAVPPRTGFSPWTSPISARMRRPRRWNHAGGPADMLTLYSPPPTR